MREARRADWAAWRVGSGRSSKCWVDVSIADHARKEDHGEDGCGLRGLDWRDGEGWTYARGLQHLG